VKPIAARANPVEQPEGFSSIQVSDRRPDEGNWSTVTADATYQIVTANRLRDGVPVYFAGGERWSPKIADATLLADAAELLSEAQAQPLVAVAPYVIEVKVTENGPKPLSLREEIRAFGPTA
jgi:hypothetical protein